MRTGLGFFLATAILVVNSAASAATKKDAVD